MDDEGTKTGHGIIIDAYLPVHEPYKSSVMSAQEMTETPIRAPNAPSIPSTPYDASDTHGTRDEKRSRWHRPHSRTTVVKLVSTNATSSAFPESFGLSISVTGRWLAAFSSSALYLISILHLPAYKSTCRAFRIRRKPLAVAISDTGKFAVLTTSHKVDVYHCGEEHGDLLRGTCKKLETIHLDNEARTLSFARCGEIVAAGSDVGLEIKSLSAGSKETDKRYITCSPADRLMFSTDGRALLATSTVKKNRYSTFVSLNESFEDAFVEELIDQQPLGKLWITQLLFPERVAARQAALLPSSAGYLMNKEILAFDQHSDRFRVFDVTMKRFTNRELGNPHDVVWTRHHKIEEATPAITSDLASIAFAVRSKTEKQVWVYHVPSSWWDAEATSSPESESSEGYSVTLDAAQNITVPAMEESAPPETITTLQWAETNGSELDRLVALVSTMNIAVPEDIVPIEAPAASGKIFLFDFENNVTGDVDGHTSSVIVDLNEIGVSEGLTDEMLELDREVDLVRRRTQIQRNRPPANPLPSPRGSLRRSLSSGSTSGGVATLRDLSHSNSGRSARRRRSFSSMSSANEDREEVVPVDEPYSQTQPRSQFSLHRAATIAANAPANRHHLRALPNRPLEYRRADGLREMPHESDADNWVPPPPPYTERPDNAVSHPISNTQVAGAQLQNSRRQRRSNGNARTRLSNIPPVPAIPPSTRSPYNARESVRATQQALPIETSSPIQRPLSSQSRLTEHISSRTNSSIAARQAASQRSAETGQAVENHRPNHRNAGSSSSSASSRASYVQHPVQPALQQSSSTAAADSAPAMSVLSGLPPNMTPPSPIAEFVRPRASSPGTPLHGNTTADQATSLHRRSDSVGSSLIRLPLAQQSTSNLRSAISTDPLRPVPANSNIIQNFTQDSSQQERLSPSRQQRPVLSRLATIASAADQRHHEGHVPEQVIQSARTAPESPATRRQWWRRGPSSRAPLRPDSRIMQYAPLEPPRHVATAPVTGRSKEKESGGKCVVM